jgi:formylglycine-generating enzyme required for sulfatase activity
MVNSFRCSFLKPLRYGLFVFLFAFGPGRAMAQQPIPNQHFVVPADQSQIYDTSLQLEWYFEKEYTTYDLYFGNTPNPPLFRAGLQPPTDGTMYSDETEGFFRSNWYDNGTNYPGVFYINYIITLDYLTTYYWRITTTDEHGNLLTSPVYTFTTPRQNVLPEPPTLQYPADLATNVSHNLTLSWQGSTADADGDEVTYDIYLGKSGTSPTRIATGVKTTTYTIPYNLEDQAIYSWYVMAVDGYSGASVMHSGINEHWYFTVENYKNDAPGVVTLNSPANGATNTGSTVQFKWNPSTDKDRDAISYYVYADTSPNPTTLLDIVSQTSYAWQAGNVFETYYWKVLAYDGHEFSAPSAINTFTPSATPVPSLLDGATNVGSRPVLAWTLTPEVVYDLYLDKSSNPTTLIASGLKTSTFCPVLASDPYAIYYWKVAARNPQGETRESATRSFTPWTQRPGSSKPEMVPVTGGAFNMGFSEYERVLPGFETWGLLPVRTASPQHAVFVDSYAIGRYEVTYTQFLAFLMATSANWHVEGETVVYDHAVASRWSAGAPVVTASPVICYVKTGTTAFDFTKDPKWLWDGAHLTIKQGFEDHPASWITPEGATLYADWAGGRLPTEAEWEYAALGGKNNSSYDYSGTNNLKACAWYLFGDTNPANPMTGINNGDPSRNNKGTNPVGRKLANALGLYDMTGNVSEYCADNWSEHYYKHADPFNPLGPLTGTVLVNRGGAFDDIQADCMIKNSRKDVHNYLAANYYQYGIRLAATDDATTTALVQGVVTDGNGEPLAGVELTDGVTKAITNDIGAYQLRVRKGATIHIAPSRTDWHFSPAFIDAGTAVARITNLNFKAYWNEDYEIRGRVVDQFGNAVNNVPITTRTGTVTTDGLGVFSMHVPANRDYTLHAGDRLAYKMLDNDISITNIRQDVNNVIIRAELVGIATIAGHVMREGTTFGENHIRMSGLPGLVFTNSSGYYQAQVTAGWSGTIIPVEDSYQSFGYATPRSAVLTDVQQNTTVDFLYMPMSPEMLTGTAVDTRGNPLAGVVITGFQDKRVITNTAGVFGIEVAKGWKGVLSAALTGYAFAPSELAVEVAANGTISTTPRFVGTPAGDYKIYGTVTDALSLPLQGATLWGFNQTTTTNINGEYSIWVDEHTSGTLLASMPAYSFNPAQATIDNIGADRQQNFTARLIQSFIVSGHVQDQAGRPLMNVTLQGFNTNVLTDADGNFSTYLPEGWSGAIRPQLNDYTFTPESFAINQLAADVVINFTGLIRTVTGVDPPQEYRFTVYPNPTHGKVTLELPAPGVVQVLTTEGRALWEGNVEQVQTITLEKSGLYLIKIFSGGKIYNSKLIVL